VGNCGRRDRRAAKEEQLKEEEKLNAAIRENLKKVKLL
jgi:hypothetical protein